MPRSARRAAPTLHRPGLAAGGRPADADEQPRPRGRRAPRGPGRLRRHRQGGPGLAVVPRHRAHARRRSKRRRDDAGAVRPAGRRVPHPRVGAAGADRQLQPGRRLGHLAGVPPPGGARPDHVRPDDRRLVDLHRHPGHPAGHVRDVRGGGRQAVRRHAGRHAHADRRLRRHGRRAAARGHHERRRLPDRRRRPGPAATAGSTNRYLDVVADDLDDALARAVAAKRDRRALSRRRGRQRRRRCLPELLRRGVADRHRHRPDQRARPAVATCPRASTSADAPDYAAAKPEEFTDRARASMARHVEAMVGFLDAGAEVFDYGNSIRGEAQLGGYERAFAFPGFVPGVHPAAVLRGQGPVPVGGAVRRPGRHRRHRPGDPRPVPGQRAAGPLDPAGRRAGRVPGPAGPDLLARATASGTRPACAFNEMVAARRAVRPDRDRPRPPRLRLGGLAVPGDRGDARRLRRDRRLAAAQRAGQHRQSGASWVSHPPRRRGRHRPVDPRRAGHAWPTAPAGRRRRSNGCSPTTRAWA